MVLQRDSTDRAGGNPRGKFHYLCQSADDSSAVFGETTGSNCDGVGTGYPALSCSRRNFCGTTTDGSWRPEQGSRGPRNGSALCRFDACVERHSYSGGRG